jgi:hypothetical protein
MRTLPSAFFTLVLSASLGVLLSIAFQPMPSRPVPPPFAAEIRDLALRFHGRPVLRGDPEDGNAGECYRRAAFQLLSGGGDELLAQLEKGKIPPGEDHCVWAEANREALAAMRRGTRRCGCALLIDPNRGADAAAPEAGIGPLLASVAVAEAIVASGEGKTPEAARILLDAARFGQDLARGGGAIHRLWACRVEFLALRWFVRLVGEGRLPSGSLRELRDETDRLFAGAHPPGETLRTEAAFLLGELGVRREADGGKAASGADRDAVLDWLRRATDAAASGKGSPADAFAAVGRIAPAGDASGSRVRTDFALLADVERRTEALRRASVLAVSLQILRRARGEFPERLEEAALLRAGLPPDPFTGKPFEYRRHSPDSAALLCAGPDGMIDGDVEAPLGLQKEIRGDWIFRLADKP